MYCKHDNSRENAELANAELAKASKAWFLLIFITIVAIIVAIIIAINNDINNAIIVAYAKAEAEAKLAAEKKTWRKTYVLRIMQSMTSYLANIDYSKVIALMKGMTLMNSRITRLRFAWQTRSAEMSSGTAFKICVTTPVQKYFLNSCTIKN
jgi:uncharacterized membrane protein YgcG